jgi:acetone carboxylase gamma subunit
VTDSTESRFVHEYIVLRTEPSGEPVLACARCNTRLCGAEENYRLSAEQVSAPIESLGDLFEGSGHTIDEQIVWRTYHCPSCGQQLDGEVCPSSAEVLWDLQLATGKEA